jgi:hypothetical protein
MGLVEIDGDLWDEETGEYAGRVDNGTLPIAVETEEDLVTVSRIISEAEARVEARRLQLENVIENTRNMLKAEERKLDYLMYRYSEGLQRLAFDMLPKKVDGSPKVSTYTNPFLKVSFRKVSASVKVEDADTALTWVRRNCPAALKVEEKVLASRIPADVLESMIADPDGAKVIGFNVVPEHRSVTIKSSVSRT